mmetsp:Transcript_4736/g.7139  ORF Transcript_4736/g.7139 Transcript_4736/m.7139 type:complete len:769 (-) Transcript_4736:190-2496(-)
MAFHVLKNYSESSFNFNMVTPYQSFENDEFFDANSSPLNSVGRKSSLASLPISIDQSSNFNYSSPKNVSGRFYDSEDLSDKNSPFNKTSKEDKNQVPLKRIISCKSFSPPSNDPPSLHNIDGSNHSRFIRNNLSEGSRSLNEYELPDLANESEKVAESDFNFVEKRKPKFNPLKTLMNFRTSNSARLRNLTSDSEISPKIKKTISLSTTAVHSYSSNHTVPESSNTANLNHTKASNTRSSLPFPMKNRPNFSSQGKSTKFVKGLKEWAGLVELQTLSCHEGAIWTIAFCKSGKFLATAGKDSNVLVWEIIRSNDSNSESLDSNNESISNSARAPTMQSSNEQSKGCLCNLIGCCRESNEENFGLENQSVFSPYPIRTLKGHKNDVFSLCWGSGELLLSGSADCSVRLWNVNGGICLGEYKHSSIVTSVDFHPFSNDFFLTGCFDKRLRIWNISKGAVVSYVELFDKITAAKFTPDGQLAIAGLMDSTLCFYNMKKGLGKSSLHRKFYNKGRGRGWNRQITGFNFFERRKGEIDDSANHIKEIAVEEDLSAKFNLLVTSSDSKARVWRLDNFQKTLRFKGMGADKAPVTASYSEDGRYVISGSDSGSILIWSVMNINKDINLSPTAETFSFRSSSGTKSSSVTCASFIPEKTLETVFGPEKFKNCGCGNKLASLRRRCDTAVEGCAAVEQSDSAHNQKKCRWLRFSNVKGSSVNEEIDLTANDSLHVNALCEAVATKGDFEGNNGPGFRGIVACDSNGSLKIFVRFPKC